MNKRSAHTKHPSKQKGSQSVPVPTVRIYGKMPQNLDRAEWLCRKLGEEVVEYLIGRTTAELCDVLAVIEALLTTHGETLDSALEELERHPRGGFSQAIMMYGRHPEFDKKDLGEPGGV